jgi:peroxiredoxin
VGFALAGLLGLPLAVSAAGETPVPIGAKIGDVSTIRDLRGNVRHLHDFKGKAFVLAFVGIDCPVANLYLPRLVELEAKYRGSDVQFLAVYPNEPEPVDQIAAHAYERNVPFPVLKDFGQVLADAVGVKRTPEVAVLDEQFVLKYRGRVDDQYLTAAQRPQPQHHDLAAALDAVLAGKEVERTEATADGCLINRQGPSLSSVKLTYHRDIEPIMQSRCQECHREGQIGPFTLTSYQDLIDNLEPVAEVVKQRRMPPWHADERYGHFGNARRMAESEVDLLLSWIEQGAPEGNAADAPPARTWHEGWQITEPDVVLTMPIEADIPATGVVPYRYYFVPTNFEEDRWVKMAQAIPGNPRVVHHIIAFMISPGRANLGGGDESGFLVGFAPGSDALMLPEGTAVRIPKGA